MSTITPDTGPTAALLLDAVKAAEAIALAEHEAGTCHLSEWSCSHCETEGEW